MTRRSVALWFIKAVHSLAFMVIATAGPMVLADGATARPRRRTAVAGAIAVTECVVYAANGFTCPLTPIAKSLGDARGSVSDIFLPDWFARNLPVIGSTILVTGIALNVRAIVRARSAARA